MFQKRGIFRERLFALRLQKVINTFFHSLSTANRPILGLDLWIRGLVCFRSLFGCARSEGSIGWAAGKLTPTPHSTYMRTPSTRVSGAPSPSKRLALPGRYGLQNRAALSDSVPGKSDFRKPDSSASARYSIPDLTDIGDKTPFNIDPCVPANTFRDVTVHCVARCGG